MSLRTSDRSIDAPAVSGRRARSTCPRRPHGALVVVGALALLGFGSTGPDGVTGVAGANAAVTATGSSFTFTGGGWGHGIGMSQYGAKGMADAGRTHTEILRHYYTGTQIGSSGPEPTVRILLAEKAGSLTLVTSGTTKLSGLGTVPAGRTVVLDRTGDKVRASGALSGSVNARTTITFPDSGPLRVSPPGDSYRYGTLVVATDSTGLRAVLGELPMNRYLWGLHEMPASWNREALKAQAVAGRTYALKRRAARRAAGADFDLYQSVLDQAYTGTRNEGSHFLHWVDAVEQTSGQVVTYGGALIDAVYSSSSGGHTEHSENVWVAQVPYLRGVPDPHDATPANSRASWSRTYTGAQLGQWFGVGTVTSVSLQAPFGVSGRVDKGNVRLVGTGGTKTVSGASFRSTVNARTSQQLLSTKFTVSASGTAPAPSPSGPPRGHVHTAFADGRTVIIGGTASDPDGAPIVRVVSTMGSQRAVREQRASDGQFLVAWAGAPGTRKVCVSVLDHPTGAETSLGCRDVVVK